jgi:hypothetical protein
MSYRNTPVLANLETLLEEAKAVSAAIKDNAQDNREPIAEEDFTVLEAFCLSIITNLAHATHSMKPHRIYIPFRPRRRPPTWRSWSALAILLVVAAMAFADCAMEELSRPLPASGVHSGK